jgi:hypothetical protein
MHGFWFGFLCGALTALVCVVCAIVAALWIWTRPTDTEERLREGLLSLGYQVDYDDVGRLSNEDYDAVRSYLARRRRGADDDLTPPLCLASFQRVS